jgi:hypothetical protein
MATNAFYKIKLNHTQEIDLSGFGWHRTWYAKMQLAFPSCIYLTLKEI